MMRPDLVVSRSSSDALWRVMACAAGEILGPEGWRALTDRLDGHERSSPSPSRRFRWLQRSLERTYGVRAGRGLAFCIGRSCFKYALREFETQLGLTGLDFRLKPTPERVRLALEALADICNRALHQPVRLEADERSLRWVMERCALCQGEQDKRNSEGVGACSLMMGVLQEMLYYVSGGRTFLIEETECIALGGRTCTITIARTPLS